jgi:hypothetical protein
LKCFLLRSLLNSMLFARNVKVRRNLEGQIIKLATCYASVCVSLCILGISKLCKILRRNCPNPVQNLHELGFRAPVQAHNQVPSSNILGARPGRTPLVDHTDYGSFYLDLSLEGGTTEVNLLDVNLYHYGTWRYQYWISFGKLAAGLSFTQSSFSPARFFAVLGVARADAVTARPAKRAS